jgi:hypothetical protein
MDQANEEKRRTPRTGSAGSRDNSRLRSLFPFDDEGGDVGWNIFRGDNCLQANVHRARRKVNYCSGRSIKGALIVAC